MRIVHKVELGQKVNLNNPRFDVKECNDTDMNQYQTVVPI